MNSVVKRPSLMKVIPEFPSSGLHSAPAEGSPASGRWLAAPLLAIAAWFRRRCDHHDVTKTHDEGFWHDETLLVFSPIF